MSSALLRLKNMFSSYDDSCAEDMGGETVKKIVIAIDGPSASGKGTLGKMLADRLNYAYLDTGAIYRAVGLATLIIGGDPSKLEDVAPALDVVKRNLTPELLSNPELRKKEVADAASKVASIPEVRAELLEYQREFAKNPPGEVGGAILDGRDIGTVVCPDADIKFFIDADVEERARRRFKDLQAFEPDISEIKVLNDLKARDRRDRNRTVAPTIAAEDAFTIDMTEKTPEEGIGEMIGKMKDKMLSQIDSNS